MTSSSTIAAVPSAARDATPYDVAQLASELHDTVAHSLSGIALAAAGACRALAGPAGEAGPQVVPDGRPDAVPDALPDVGAAGVEHGPLLATMRAIEACAVEAMTDLHGLLALLRAGSRATGRRDGVPSGPAARSRRVTELPALVARAQAAGLSVTLHERGCPRPLDRRVDHVAFRVVQEGLTNAMKYAGTGAAVQVLLRWSGRRLEVAVRTFGADGAGRPGGTGQGLAGLAQRVISHGGCFTAGPDGPGFRTEALLPIGPPQPAATRGGPIANRPSPAGS